MLLTPTLTLSGGRQRRDLHRHARIDLIHARASPAMAKWAIDPCLVVAQSVQRRDRRHCSAHGLLRWVRLARKLVRRRLVLNIALRKRCCVFLDRWWWGSHGGLLLNAIAGRLLLDWCTHIVGVDIPVELSDLLKQESQRWKRGKEMKTLPLCTCLSRLMAAPSGVCTSVSRQVQRHEGSRPQ
jgi:hypothetical protein